MAVQKSQITFRRQIYNTVVTFNNKFNKNKH